MAENIKLKDLYDEEQSYTDIGTIAVPKTDGSGNTYYVQRPIINYTLQDPPTHELTDGVFAWNMGDGTFLGESDPGNFSGAVSGPVEGKTTKPIAYMRILKTPVTGVTETPWTATALLYLYESLTSAVLLEILNIESTAVFTAEPGWGQMLYDKDGNVTGYAQIADPAAVTFGIQQPNNLLNESDFYSLLSEVTQDTQSVDVTENGAQTIVPTSGKSGIRKVALNVNVPSSGGNLQEKSVSITSNGTTEVTPDAGYDGMSKLTAMVNVAGGVDAKSWVFTNGVASISQADFNKYLAPGVIAAIFINVPLEPVGGTGYSQMQNVMRSESSDGSAQLVFAGEEYSLDETSDPKILTPTVGGFGIISRASADADFVLSYVNAYGNTITPAFTSNGVQVTLYAQLLQL